MRSPAQLWLVAGALSLVSVAASAADTKPYPACTSTPTEADRKGAQGAFAAGQGSFNEADYATAITYWRDAYRRDCTAHALLLNLARAYELKGDRAEAVNALETYLARKPDDPTADQIQRRIENLKKQMAPAPATSAPPSSSAVPAAATTHAPPPPSPEAPAGTKKSIVPWFVVGGGALVTLIGLSVYGSGQKKVHDAETLCPDRKCPASVPDQQSVIDSGNQGRSQENTGGALALVGVAAITGGLLWHFVWDKGTPAQSATAAPPSLTPAVGPGYAGVALGSSF
jgi:tetratricopeptide (TPR) repeat protein